MQVISNERVVFFDVDGTLVLSPDNAYASGADELQIFDPYCCEVTYRSPHRPHIKLLKNYVARGAEVIVWSKNGYRWAAEVLKALELDHLNITVMTKPCVYVDDEVPENWLGEHVFIPATSSFGNGG